MIGAVLGLILLCIVLGVLVWAGKELLKLIPLGEPFATILRILLVVLTVIIVVWIFIQLLALAGIHVPIPHA